MQILIKEVSDNHELRKFIDFPHDLYKNDKNYVPELYFVQKEMFDPKKSLFLKHSEVQLFIAIINNRIAGRIAAIKNNNYINYTGNNYAHFGFFEVIDNYEVAYILLERACKWAKSKGLTKILGPENYSTNETCGLLIDGFDSPPVVLMTYNKPYYQLFIEKFGFTKCMDLLAYKLTVDGYPEKMFQATQLIEDKIAQNGIIVRKINVKKVDEEINKIWKVYVSAWEKNWGYVPMNQDEFDRTGKELKQIADPDFIFLAEKDGQIIGVSVTIPDINEVLINIKRGRLFPTGIFKLLFNRKKIKSIRILILGVLEEYRKLGIDTLFYNKTCEIAAKKGIKSGEASWILENNAPMNNALQKLNGKVYKTYRIFEKTL